jgi:2-C-methyl-D-erythritol 4-phosphate cytidylyltransferase
VNRPPTAQIAVIVALPAEVVDNPAVAVHPLSGGSPLQRAVRGLADGPVVVAADARIVEDVRTHLADSPVTVLAVDAPADRMRCLAAGLDAVTRDRSSHVLVHDVRQPLVPAGVRDRVVAALRDGAAAVLPVLAVTDSVKAVDRDGVVTATVDRSTLRAAQYPRGFATGELARLLAAGEPDEVAAAIRLRVPVTVVEGDGDAFVADLPGDAAYVDAVIACSR